MRGAMRGLARLMQNGLQRSTAGVRRRARTSAYHYSILQLLAGILLLHYRVCTWIPRTPGGRPS